MNDQRDMKSFRFCEICTAEGEAQASTIQQLTEQNAALTAQLKSTGHAPYLERMKELADKRDAAEQALTVLRGALLNELEEKDTLSRGDVLRLLDRTGSTAASDGGSQ